MSRQENTSGSVPSSQGTGAGSSGGGSKSGTPRKSHVPSRTSSAPPEEHASEVKSHRNFQPTKTHQNFVQSTNSNSSPDNVSKKSYVHGNKVEGNDREGQKPPPISTNGPASGSDGAPSSTIPVGVPGAATGPVPQGVLLNRPGNPAAGASSNSGTPTNRNSHNYSRERSQISGSNSYSSRSGRDSRDRDNRRRGGSHQQSQQHGSYGRNNQQSNLRNSTQQQNMHGSHSQQHFSGSNQSSNRWSPQYGPDSSGGNYGTSPQALNMSNTGTPPMHGMPGPVGMTTMGGHQMFSGSPNNQGMIPTMGQTPVMYNMQLPPAHQQGSQRMNMQQQQQQQPFQTAIPQNPNMYGFSHDQFNAVMMGQFVGQPDFGNVNQAQNFQPYQFVHQQQQQYPMMARQPPHVGQTFIVPNQQVVMHQPLPVIAQGTGPLHNLPLMYNSTVAMNQQPQQFNQQNLQTGGRYPGQGMQNAGPMMQSLHIREENANTSNVLAQEDNQSEGQPSEWQDSGDQVNRRSYRDGDSAASSKPKLKYSSKSGKEINLQDFARKPNKDDVVREQDDQTAQLDLKSDSTTQQPDPMLRCDDDAQHAEIPSVSAQLEALHVMHPVSMDTNDEIAHAGLTPAPPDADECFSPPIKVHNLPVSIASGVIASADALKEDESNGDENTPPEIPVSVPVSIPSAPVSIPSTAVSLPRDSGIEPSMATTLTDSVNAEPSTDDAEGRSGESKSELGAQSDSQLDPSDSRFESDSKELIESQSIKQDKSLKTVAPSSSAPRSLRPGGGKSNIAIRLNQGPKIIKYSKNDILSFKPKQKPEVNPLPMYATLSTVEYNTSNGNVGIGSSSGRGGQWSKQAIARGDDKDRDSGWKRGETNIPPEMKRGKSRSNIPMPKKVITDPLEILSTEATEILNKITPQTFEKLSARMLELPVKNVAMMDRLIQIIFDKAVQDRNFTSMYAELCNILNTDSSWNFFFVAQKTDTSDYFWVREYSFPETCAGPFFSAKEYLKAVTAEVMPEMRPMNVTSLVISDTLLIDDVLLRVYFSEVTKEYFVTYVAFADLDTDKLSQEMFSESKDAVKNAKNQTSFRARLVNNCQTEYQRNQDDDLLGKNEEERRKLHALRKTLSDEEFLAKEEEIDEIHYKLKSHILGTIRFVGELYKIGLLTSVTIHTCVSDLLGSEEKGWKCQFDEQDLEVLCQLLTSTGSKLESKSSSDRSKLDSYFNRLDTLTKDKSINSRLRFTIEQLIDLRKNQWQKRHQQEGPLKIDEIHQKIQNEQQHGYGRVGSFSGRHTSASQQYNQPKSIMQRPQQRGSGSQDARNDRRAGAAPGPRSHGGTPNARSHANSNHSTPTARNGAAVVTAPSAPASASKIEFDESYNFPQDTPIHNRTHSTLKEYFDCLDVNEVIAFFEESPQIACGHFFLLCVQMGINTTNQTELERLFALMEDPSITARLLSGKQYVSLALIKCEMLLCLVDTEMDYREAPERIGRIIGILMKLNVISEADFEESLANAKQFNTTDLCAPVNDVEKIFGRYVQAVHGVRDAKD